jgi:hypothetical protein
MYPPHLLRNTSECLGNRVGHQGFAEQHEFSSQGVTVRPLRLPRRRRSNCEAFMRFDAI